MTTELNLLRVCKLLYQCVGGDEKISGPLLLSLPSTCYLHLHKAVFLQLLI